MIAAYDLYLNNHPISAVITIGAPPTFKQKMADNYDYRLRNNTFRFVNNFDIIPSLMTKILQFKHVGQSIYFQGKSCRPTLDSQFRSTVLGIPDHSLDKYLGCFLKQY